MKIQMTNWFVNELKIQSKQISKQKYDKAKEEKDNDQFSFSYGSIVQDGGNTFQIGFKVIVNNPRFLLNLEMIYNFTTDEVLSSAFSDSDFIKINAPAIAFPYLRSFISTVTLQSGYQCVILPSVNFVSLAKQSKNSKTPTEKTEGQTC